MKNVLPIAALALSLATSGCQREKPQDSFGLIFDETYLIEKLCRDLLTQATPVAQGATDKNGKPTEWRVEKDGAICDCTDSSCVLITFSSKDQNGHGAKLDDLISNKTPVRVTEYVRITTKGTQAVEGVMASQGRKSKIIRGEISRDEKGEQSCTRRVSTLKNINELDVNTESSQPVRRCRTIIQSTTNRIAALFAFGKNKILEN